MYPYRSKLRWLAFGRYAHLAKAIGKRPPGLQDSLLDDRLESLLRWNRIRFIFTLALSLGVLAAAGAWIAGRLPSFDAASEFLDSVAAYSSAAAGILTVAYLFLTRLLGQIEADILALVTVGRRK